MIEKTKKAIGEAGGTGGPSPSKRRRLSTRLGHDGWGVMKRVGKKDQKRAGE